VQLLGQGLVGGEGVQVDLGVPVQAAQLQASPAGYAGELGAVPAQIGRRIPFADAGPPPRPAVPPRPDVDRDGNATRTQQRVHQLIRQPSPIADRTFEITSLDPGAQAYCFTFG
jgi:hypothetical protein